MQLLQQRVSTGLDNVTNTLAGVSSQVRDVGNKVSELAGLQNAHDSNKLAVERVERTLETLGARFEKWFDDFKIENERRWEMHEQENASVQRDQEKKIQDVRDTVTKWGGFAIAVAVLGGALVTGFLYNINYRFNDNNDDIDNVAQAALNNRALIDKNADLLHHIQLYLARGGRVPEDPYVTPDQSRKTR